jgi:hypothetical protein
MIREEQNHWEALPKLQAQVLIEFHQILVTTNLSIKNNSLVRARKDYLSQKKKKTERLT